MSINDAYAKVVFKVVIIIIILFGDKYAFIVVRFSLDRDAHIFVIII